jgi:hypothetical protein
MNGKQPHHPAPGRYQHGPAGFSWLTVVLAFLFLLPGQTLLAGDEEMNPSMYQVFDPVTGYMVPADELTDPQSAAAQHTTNQTHKMEPAEESAQTAGVTSSAPYALLAGIAATLGLISGIAYWFYSYRKKIS